MPGGGIYRWPWPPPAAEGGPEALLPGPAAEPGRGRRVLPLCPWQEAGTGFEHPVVPVTPPSGLGLQVPPLAPSLGPVGRMTCKLCSVGPEEGLYS